MRKALAGLFIALGISALFLPGAQAQITGASTGIRTVVSDLIEWTGTQKFRDDVTIGGNLTVTGTQTFAGDLTLTENLTVNGNSVSITTGNFEVLAGESTFSGPITSPMILGASTVGKFAYGSTALTEAGGAETVLTVTNATTQLTGGRLDYAVSIQDTAATPDDNAMRIGHFQFGMLNSAGTVICTADASDETNDDSHLVQQGVAKTVTYAIAATAGSNTCVISFNLDSDMTTVTTGVIKWTLTLYGPGTVS